MSQLYFHNIHLPLKRGHLSIHRALASFPGSTSNFFREKSWEVEPGNEANRALHQVPKVEGFHFNLYRTLIFEVDVYSLSMSLALMC